MAYIVTEPSLLIDAVVVAVEAWRLDLTRRLACIALGYFQWSGSLDAIDAVVRYITHFGETLGGFLS